MFFGIDSSVTESREQHITAAVETSELQLIVPHWSQLLLRSGLTQGCCDYATVQHYHTNLHSSQHTDDKLIKSPAQVVQRELQYDGNLRAVPARTLRSLGPDTIKGSTLSCCRLVEEMHYTHLSTGVKTETTFSIHMRKMNIWEEANGCDLVAQPFNPKPWSKYQNASPAVEHKTDSLNLDWCAFMLILHVDVTNCTRLYGWKEASA